MTSEATTGTVISFGNGTTTAHISSAFHNAPYLIDDYIAPTDVTCPPLTNLFGFTNVSGKILALTSLATLAVGATGLMQGMGWIGRGEGIAVMAVATLVPSSDRASR